MKSRTDDDEPVGGKRLKFWGRRMPFGCGRAAKDSKLSAFSPRDATNKEAYRDQSDKGDEKQ
jgi:hypothetical protein